MANGTRWTREFTNWNTFLNELGEIGIHVDPRLGASAVTQGQMEDYVLRRVLKAMHHQGRLQFPLTVCASNQTPGIPDYVLLSGEDFWGLEITEAGSQNHQSRTTLFARHPDTEVTSDDITQKETALDDYRKAIEKKNDKHDNGAYDHVTQCDLAVYDNTGTYLMNIQDVQGINNPCLHGRFHEVFIVHETGDRGEGDVYTNVLSDQPGFVHLG